jgi:hypothetical protein
LAGAIILHDLGMFIERAGLKRLIFGEHKNRREEYLDELTWNKTWLDFYSKARRYTDRQLIHLFGNSSPVGKLPFDDVPEGNCLLYGEFLRQNHARLAFDITQIGFPGDNLDIDIFEKCDCDESVKTMIGLIARSHTMKLRNTENFLKNYQLTPKTIPLFYLMVVLRMADILHIGRERAPKFAELKDKINSPESQRQFHLNQTIIDGPSFDFKQKSVYINAAPDCTNTFKDVESLIHNIQKELDSCWAVLAEKYAYDYEISIHRITSNLLEEEKIASFNKKFLTHKVTLDVNPDIVKLLIKPLYGNNPSFGVRELVQNAVDACNERKAADDEFIGKITVRVDTNKKVFEISDNGIGMNEDVLRNYFLVAGSSYRYSDVWQKKHIDDDRKAKFARSGHFGIGALASFLIGDVITVTTRYKDDDLGYHFTYTIEPKTLDVKRIDTEIGTKIVIQINERALTYFISDKGNDYKTNLLPKASDINLWYHWFHFSTPEIYYYFNEKQVGKKQFIISNNNDIENDWHNVTSSVFSNMKLNFIINKDLFLVNGIMVKGNESPHYFSIGKYGFKAPFPGISIEDINNDLNLDISRTKIFYFPENTLVVEETLKYYLARLLKFPECDVAGLVDLYKFYDRKIVVSKFGFTICSPSFIYHTKQKKVFLLFCDDALNIFDHELLSYTQIAIISNFYDFISKIEIDGDVLMKGTEYENYIGHCCKNFWANSSIRHEGFFGVNPELFRKRNRNLPPFGLTLSDDLELIIEYVPNNPCETEKDNLMLKVLSEYLPVDINDGWIPFDMKEREKLYPKAFSELKRYM